MSGQTRSNMAIARSCDKDRLDRVFIIMNRQRGKVTGGYLPAIRE
jgi:hypothetical protein